MLIGQLDDLARSACRGRAWASRISPRRTSTSLVSLARFCCADVERRHGVLVLDHQSVALLDQLVALRLQFVAFSVSSLASAWRLASLLGLDLLGRGRPSLPRPFAPRRPRPCALRRRPGPPSSSSGACRRPQRQTTMNTRLMTKMSTTKILPIRFIRSFPASRLPARHHEGLGSSTAPVGVLQDQLQVRKRRSASVAKFVPGQEITQRDWYRLQYNWPCFGKVNLEASSSAIWGIWATWRSRQRDRRCCGPSSSADAAANWLAPQAFRGRPPSPGPRSPCRRRQQAQAGRQIAVVEIPTARGCRWQGSATITSVVRRRPWARIRPLESIQAEKPVLAAIKNGLRHSTARNTAQARCMSNSLEPQNQPSLVRFTSTSGSRPRARSCVDLPADQMRHRVLVADVGRIAHAGRSRTDCGPLPAREPLGSGVRR